MLNTLRNSFSHRKQVKPENDIKYGRRTKVRHTQTGAKLSGKTVKTILKDLGLTENEIDVYIFLAKHGVLKSREVARQLRKDRAQILRILKSLQGKGLLESTLEVPKRFSAVPLEKVLNAFVKAKRDEANIIESTKRDLLIYWKSIGKKPLEAPLEKFVVIDGDNKIYSKISQMITETKNQLSIISTTRGLIRAAQLGIFDVIAGHPLQSIRVRFLTELLGQNSNALKNLLRKASKAGISFRGKNPDLGLKPFPRMVIKDTEEVLLFINPTLEESETKSVDTGLWTNCKTLVETFSAVFEDLWRNASNAQQEANVGTGPSSPKTFILSNLETVHKKYAEIMNATKEQITFMTSSQGLIELHSNMSQLKDLTEKGVSVKVMAPTTVENLRAVQQLSKYCQVRHAPESHLKTTIIDGTHLFQFRNASAKRRTPSEEPGFADAFYTSDSELVAKTEKVLNGVWQKAQVPSAVTLESILNPPTTTVDPFRKMKLKNPYIKGSINIEEFEQGVLTEKDVLSKILNAKKITAKDPLKDINILCGSNAHAVIHPPEYFNLPDMIITVWHCDKRSSWGTEDWLTVSMWLETPKGYRYAPVAHVTDNSEALEFRKGVYSGTPAGHNCQLVNKDQFQVQVHGNTLFAGWTLPIQLMPPSHVLPPSCIMFEGYGQLRTVVTKTRAVSGRTQVTEANRFNAFVTFFHPASKYSGPGTDGLFNRDVFFTAYPPT
jgi:sugar-specific transcriptional regulator TrmB